MHTIPVVCPNSTLAIPPSSHPPSGKESALDDNCPGQWFGMSLDTSFTKCLEDSVIDPNLLGGCENLQDGTYTNNIAAVKDEVLSDITSPDLDIFSRSSPAKSSTSSNLLSITPPTPPCSPPATRKRGRPRKQQQPPPQEQPKPKRTRHPIVQMDHNPESPDHSSDSDSDSDSEPSTPQSHSRSQPQSQARAKSQARISRIREKNRVAASKCRRKQRKANGQLQAKFEKLEERHSQLCSEVGELEAEAYVLKNMLMSHGSCGCELIQQYFKDLAASLMHKMDLSSHASAGISSSMNDQG
ncbi:hypothetical protein PT974_10133 [Cladobotryum mycophilum]|uniref:BZIP domain-containing protein n=1 Tax=Cladobotryum mycophilum TaxID=491253 RepID=A0ABR0S905_9HYPO